MHIHTKLMFSFRQAALTTCAVALVLVPFQHLSAASACGAPNLDPAIDAGVFLWQDCPSDQWHARFTSEGGWLSYAGTVDSNLDFTNVAPVSIESGDKVDFTTNPSIITYQLGMLAPWLDGFEFSHPVGASVCFGVDKPAATPVFVGSDRTPVTAPFDLTTLGPCNAVQPTLSIGDISVGEGASIANFIVRLSSASTESVSVDYVTANGSATAGSDYIETSGAVVFGPGATTQLVPVTILDDSVAQEGNETFDVNLSNPINALLGDASATGTITDNDGTALCGTPGYDSSVDKGAFLWQDCVTGMWSARYTAGGGAWTKYVGMVESDQAFATVVPVSVESGDTFDYTTNPGKISYQLGVINQWQDGFDFSYAAGAKVCFGLDLPAGTAVLVGPARTPVNAPFNPETLGPCDSVQPPPPGDGYNIVVIFTDDQRFDTLSQMPNVLEDIASRGVTFNNAYVPTPYCSPARASTYSGGYLAQNTGNLENREPNGGINLYDDRVNLGTELQKVGYQTLFVGKWDNNYPLLAPYVPPGWDTFAGRNVWASGTDWSSFQYLVGSSDQASGIGSQVNASGQYNVYFERDQVLNFLNNKPQGKPFFVFWSTSAPHPPATPAPGDENLFSTFTYRGRGYGESDLSDKPKWVQNYSGSFAFSGDEAVRNQLRSLQSVDRSVGDIVDKVTALGELDNTVFIYTSDNGYMWGERRFWGKGFAYEESLRVPLAVVIPGIQPRTDDHLVSGVLDLGPTIYDIAGVPHQTDGMSLVPIMTDPNANWRDELFFERYGTNIWGNALWAGVRKGDWKYTRYWTGEEELYDLRNDPYELESQHNNPLHEGTRLSLSNRTDELLGLAIMPRSAMPLAQVGVQYNFQFETWGGKAPFNWKIASGQLPQGMWLDQATGTINGTPQSAGVYTFTVQVTDSEIATQINKARTFISGEMQITVE